MVHEVLELCCFEWFQNLGQSQPSVNSSFRAVLFRMVPKPTIGASSKFLSFRAVLFRMVPKQAKDSELKQTSFRAVLFRMVPKPNHS